MILPRRTLLAAAATLAGCTGHPPDLDAPETPWPVAGDYPQRFRTEANRIVDSTGQPRVLRGVALADVTWLIERGDDNIGFVNRATFRAAAEWGASLVRISFMPAVIRRHGLARCLKALVACIAYARRYGLYLVPCFHSIGFPPDGRWVRETDWFYGDLYRTTDAEILAFWQALARRCAQEPTVAFYELFNEPQVLAEDGSLALGESAQDWLRWRDWCEGLVDAIRREDPLKPCIVGGLAFSYNLAPAAEAPLRRGNIVYATHPYAGSDWRVGWEDAFLWPARFLPVLATELGWDANHHRESAQQGPVPYRQAIFQALAEAGIGWTAWCFSHRFTPALLSGPRDHLPTEYGQVVQAALRANPQV